MSSITDSPTKFAILQYLEDPSTNPAVNQNDSLPEKWLNDALTWEEAWEELKFIDWNYWFNFPSWKREDAAYLFFGIDPITVRSEDIADDTITKAKRFVAFADATQKNNMCPRDWLEWGRNNKFHSMGGIKSALSKFIPTKETKLNEQLSEVAIEIAEEIKPRIVTKEEMFLKRSQALDENLFRGSKRMLLEAWDDIERLHGTTVDGRKVLRILNRNYPDNKFALKTIQNHLILMRKEKFIP